MADRVVLVHDGLPIMAAGLPALAAHLRDHGFDAQVWNLHAEGHTGDVRDLAEDLEGVFLLGISVHWFYQLPPAIRLARQARESAFDGYVVLGGFTASLFAEELVARHADVDGVIQGDGELPLLDLARELRDGSQRFERVPNLVWRSDTLEVNGITYVGGPEEVDVLSFGRLDVVRNLEAHLATSSWRAITDGSVGMEADLDRTLYLCGGRGCSVDCATCGGGRSAHRLHSARDRFCFRSPDRIADDVQQATELGCTSIHACFDPAPASAHWPTFMEELQRRAIRSTLIFECFGLPTAAFLQQFSETFERGILVLSPETSHVHIRDRVKGLTYDNEALEETLVRATGLGLQVQLFLGYFVPHETLSDLRGTRLWARDIARRHGPSVQVLHYPYSTDPGSPIARRPHDFGILCDMETAADYERELTRQEPWLDNLLRHRPSTGEAPMWRAATLALEIDRACRAESPDWVDSLEARSTGRADEVFLGLARRLLDTVPEHSLRRGQLASIVRRAIGGKT